MKKIPVWKTIADGYSFAFGHLGAIIGLTWLPMVLVTVSGYFAMSQYYRSLLAALESGNTAAVGQSLLAVLGWMILALALYSMMYAAVTRFALGLKPGPAFISFHFGADEMRVFGALAAIAALAAFFLIIYVLIRSGLGMIANAQMAGGLASLVDLIYALAMIFVFVRLGFFLIPVTITAEKIDLVRGWKLSAGNFWRIFLVLLAAVGPLIIVTLVGEFFILGSKFFAPQAATDTAARTQAMIAQLRIVIPNLPLLMGFSFFLAPLMMGLGLGPPVGAYRALSENGSGAQS